MKKENFICPCCGLPNHLEFKSERDYRDYLEQDSAGNFSPTPSNYIFDKYILGEEEEESSRREEIKGRYDLIKQYSNKYQDIDFKEWFGKEVVGFINDQNQSNQEQEDEQNDNVQSGEGVSP